MKYVNLQSLHLSNTLSIHFETFHFNNANHKTKALCSVNWFSIIALKVVCDTAGIQIRLHSKQRKV